MRKLFVFVSLLFCAVFSSACIHTLAVQELNEIAAKYLDEGDPSSAISRLESSIDLDPNVYESHYNLAVAYYYINHTSLALEYLNNAAQISDSEELHLLKAEILLKVNTKEAIKEYVKLNELYPDNADYVRRLANLYIQNKNYLQARKVLKSYLKTHPEERDNERFSTYKILLLFS